MNQTHTPLKMNKSNKKQYILYTAFIIIALSLGIVTYKYVTIENFEKLFSRNKPKVEFHKNNDIVKVSNSTHNNHIVENISPPRENTYVMTSVNQTKNTGLVDQILETQATLKQDENIKNTYLSEEETLSGIFNGFPQFNTNEGNPEPTITKVGNTRIELNNNRNDPMAYKRKSLTKEQLIFEPTGLKVQYSFRALFPKIDNTPPQKIPLNVPVLHESRRLALTKAEINKMHDLVLDIRTWQTKLNALQEEGITIAKEWNTIIKKGTPEDFLLPDSPSLIENQDGTEILELESKFINK